MDAETGHRVRPGPPRLDDFDYSRSDVVYFVTICAASGSSFTDPAMAATVINALHWLRSHRGIRLYAYCLMPDHLHLLLQLPEQTDVAGASVLRRGSPHTLGSIISALKGFTTRQSWNLSYEGQLWQTNFYDHILRGYESGMRIAAYILANPVRAGLVAEAEDYPWSGMPDPL